MTDEQKKQHFIKELTKTKIRNWEYANLIHPDNGSDKTDTFLQWMIDTYKNDKPPETDPLRMHEAFRLQYQIDQFQNIITIFQQNDRLWHGMDIVLEDIYFHGVAIELLAEYAMYNQDFYDGVMAKAKAYNAA